jgi:hypothetical protein
MESVPIFTGGRNVEKTVEIDVGGGGAIANRDRKGQKVVGERLAEVLDRL